MQIAHIATHLGVRTPWEMKMVLVSLSFSPLVRKVARLVALVVSGQGVGQRSLGHSKGQEPV